MTQTARRAKVARRSRAKKWAHVPTETVLDSYSRSLTEFAAAVENTATWNATADGRAVKESKPFRKLPERIQHRRNRVPLPPSVLSIAPSHIEAIYVMKNLKNHGSPRWKNHLSRMAEHVVIGSGAAVDAGSTHCRVNTDDS